MCNSHLPVTGKIYALLWVPGDADMINVASNNNSNSIEEKRQHKHGDICGSHCLYRTVLYQKGSLKNKLLLIQNGGFHTTLR